MYKKFILTIIMVLSFIPSCFAVSNIEINNVTKKQVMDYIMLYASRSGFNYMLESVNDYGATFVGSQARNNIFGMQVATQQNKISVTLVENGNNVIVTLNEVAYLYYNNGHSEVHPVNDVPVEQGILVALKQYFNDYYLFGYTPTDKKKDGGFVIGEVDPDSPFGERGIKAGDVIVAVNGEKVRDNKRAFLWGSFHEKFMPTTCKFLIKRDGVEHIYTITSKFYKAPYTIEKEKQAQIAAQNNNV